MKKTNYLLSGGPARGFTLVELLIVLAVASILAGTALPSFLGLIKSVQLTTSTNDLFSSLLVARSEAAKRHSRAAVCKSTDGNTCAGTGGWEQGWIVFHDANNNGRRDADEQIIERTGRVPGHVRILGNLNVAKYISYASTGETKLASGAFQAGTITLCSIASVNEEARQIVISAAGRPRVQKTRAASCA
jgi:type IV fimbrial biogenesis protein FimT